MKVFVVKQYKKHEYADVGWENIFGVFDDREKAEEEILKYLKSISLSPVNKWDDVCRTRIGYKVIDINLVCFSIEEYSLNTLRETT